MIVHGSYQVAPEAGQTATGPVREVAVEASTYEEARDQLYAAANDDERLLGIRVDGRAEWYRPKFAR